MLKILRWQRNIWIAIDQLVNAIFWGDPDETISSRLGKIYVKSAPARLVCKVISVFFREPKHCQRAVEEDEGGNAV